jgi:hypothetical protein
MPEARVARVTEVIAGSPKGFDDAVKICFADPDLLIFHDQNGYKLANLACISSQLQM